MSRVLAALTLVGLMAAVAVVGFNMPRPLLGSDRNRGERHERVSLAAIAALPTAVVALDVREIEQAIAEE